MGNEISRVKWIISASAVGSLKEEIKPLDMVLPDQFIDRTKERPITFFGDGAVAHVALADPFVLNLLIYFLKKLLLLCQVIGLYIRGHIPLYGGTCILNKSRI